MPGCRSPRVTRMANRHASERLKKESLAREHFRLISGDMITMLRSIVCGVGLALGAAVPGYCQTSPEAPPAEKSPESAKEDAFFKLVKSLNWVTEGKGSLGTMATLEIPAGYRFTATEGTTKMMEAYGNLTSGSELGFVSPLDAD